MAAFTSAATRSSVVTRVSWSVVVPTRVTATGVAASRPAAISALAVSAIVPMAESSTSVGVSAWCAQSTPRTWSRHETNATSRLSLEVSGMPAYAGTALTDEMPGTISRPRPAFTQACASSGPEA